MRQWVKLKPGKEKKVRHFYPSVYREEVSEVAPSVNDGDLVAVLDAKGKWLAWGTYSAKSHIAVRILSTTDERIDTDFFVRRLQQAMALRQSLASVTNAYRVVYSEADFLPGLVVDKYADTVVVQVRTKGMERLRPFWFDALLAVLQPQSVYERSDMEGRREEGLVPVKGALYGEVPERIEITEHGLRFFVDVRQGLKTGFFLDQRENRKRMQEMVQPGERFLDLFAYTGAFSLYAAAKGAECVAVEQQPHFIALGQDQARLNGLQVLFRCGNVFEELPKLVQEKQTFDVAVIDPPAVAKRENQLPSLRKAIYRVVRDTLPLLRPGGRMLVCACVYPMDWSDLWESVRFAASDLQVPLRVLAQWTQGSDHPIRLHIPETQYLRCLLLQRD